MNKEKVLKEIKKSFDDDIKNRIGPIYDISTLVHDNTLRDLKDLFEAVADFAFEKGLKSKK